MFNYQIDNTIEWIFEKIFDQVIRDNFISFPFDEIKETMFENGKIHHQISNVSCKDTISVKKYLTNPYFIKRFMFKKLKNKINVSILLNDFEWFLNLISSGYQINDQSIILAIVHDRFEFFSKIIEFFSPKLENMLLYYGCHSEKFYFFLKEKNLVPNISVYNKAVNGNSIKIIQDINQYVGISSKTMEMAFENNNTNIIFFLIKEAEQSGIKIKPEWINYSIINENEKIIKYFEEKKIKMSPNNAYYSAILSGSLEMISMMEDKFPDIHSGRNLDRSVNKTQKGKSSLLLDEISYKAANGKIFFSHTINYAVQSESLEMIKYIYSKGYPVTLSNIITAIKQNNVDILEYLVSNFEKKIPYYIIHYLGISSFHLHKDIKSKIILNNAKYQFYPFKKTLDDLRKEDVHLKLIEEVRELSQENMMDVDYLMNYRIFFIPYESTKINYLLINTIKLCLQLGMRDKIKYILKNLVYNTDKQYAIDVLFLFGTVSQIKQYYPMINLLRAPNVQIISELICCSQIGKLCYLINYDLISSEMITILSPIITALSDVNIDNLFGNFGIEKKVKYIILSGKEDLIESYLMKNNDISDRDIKDILLLENLNLIKKYLPCIKIYRDWCLHNDLLEIVKFIDNID